MAGAPKPEAAEAAAPLFGTPMADPFPSLGESESVAVPTKASGGNGCLLYTSPSPRDS